MPYLTGGLDPQDNDGATAPELFLVGAGGVYANDSASSGIWVVPTDTDQVLVSQDEDTPIWQLLTNANVDSAAAIDYSKLNLTGSIRNADISATAAIAYTKLNLTGSIVNADVAAGAAIVVSKLAGGTDTYILVTSGTTPTWTNPTSLSIAKKILTIVLNGDPRPGRSRTVIVPRGYNDGSVTISLTRVRFRAEFAASTGTTTVLIQKSSGGDAEPSWSTIATLTLASGHYEATDVTSSLGTVSSGDLLSAYFSGVGDNLDDYTITIQGNE